MKRVDSPSNPTIRGAGGAALLLAVLAVCWSPPAGADTPLPSVEEITKRLDDLYRSTSSQGKMSMKIVTKHYTRTLEMEIWSRGEDKMLAVIRAPARSAGTATLKTADGLWNYAVRADRLIRVPPGLLGDGWMGSHFTNDDLMRENSYAKTYRTKAEWATVDGARLLRLQMIPREGTPVPFTKLEFYLTPTEYLPVKAVYWDKADVVRNEYFRAPKVFDGRKIPTVIQVVPTDKPGESTTVTYQKMRFGGSVPDRLFTARGLRKVAQQR